MKTISFPLALLLLLSGCSPSAEQRPPPGPAVRVPSTQSFNASPSALTSVPTLEVKSVILSGASNRITQIAWNPDGTLLAEASGDAVRLWSPSGQAAGTLTGATGSVLSLAWSPDGRWLASGSTDQSVRLWRTEGGPAEVIKLGEGYVWALAWSPDGSILATGSINGWLNPTVQLWNVRGGLTRRMRTRFSGGKFYNLLWSPDGKLLLGGATDYALWGADGSQVAYLPGCEHCTPFWGAAWSPDGSMFAIGDENGGLQVYDKEGRLLDARQSRDDVNAISWSPDGQLLAAGQDLWKADKTRLAVIDGRINALAWSADGKYLAAAEGNLITVIRAGDGVRVAELTGHTDIINRLAWSPAALILASASDDRSIRLWLFP